MYRRVAVILSCLVLVSISDAVESLRKQTIALTGKNDHVGVYKLLSTSDFAVVSRDPYLLRRLACAAASTGRNDKATSHFDLLLKLHPKDPINLNAAAWYWATAADESYRNGKRAVELSMQACRETEFKNPVFLDTAAAAYAEAGDFGLSLIHI